ncbi:hypothetical protein [Nocardia australiensis]|uniref:hypothetical protein n=1 Tax=Nocardia australiensis TaxID=2887191 RepID=UPI001D137158|nr:hypothetical protein [Nocardia australiensis]
MSSPPSFTTATTTGPLPDEMPAAALWSRLELEPAALDTDHTHRDTTPVPTSVKQSTTLTTPVTPRASSPTASSTSITAKFFPTPARSTTHSTTTVPRGPAHAG